ncbi:helix-turn-helix transcriptional regulator [uncultured Pseudodesulfovibrio sp.]|uniref:helix-turn-helix domain-containing protein n=1 Tax=uncultured Pseudodesulfovibrio sp. TaxID=2035858 RepID=UPI0029C90294|nr:helix-turn-helix transcriptional regulator [uncultured Pseudodesulfovibrio sp.]
MAVCRTDFSKKVKEVRRQLDMSQQELACTLKVSIASINRWENGKTIPFKLTREQFDSFCKKMIRQGRMSLVGGIE